MGNKFLGFMRGMEFYEGTKVRLLTPETYGNIETGIVDSISLSDEVVILKRCKPGNGLHIHPDYKNVSKLYVHVLEVDILSQPKNIPSDNFKIWW